MNRTSYELACRIERSPRAITTALTLIPSLLILLSVTSPATTFWVGATPAASLPPLSVCTPSNTVCLGEHVHQNITNEALQGVTGPSGVSFSAPAIKQIQDSNMLVDKYQWDHGAHFDNLYWRDGAARLQIMEQKLKSAFQQGSPITTPQANTLRVMFGTYLHTLQDFYAHSNYVNLTDPPLILFPDNGSSFFFDLGQFTPPGQPSRLDDGLQFSCTDPSHLSAGPGHTELTSGFYGQPAPFGECDHGDISGTPLLGNQGINKDSPRYLGTTTLRPGYPEARAAAVDATARFAQYLLFAATPDDACVFMTDSKCPSGGGGGGTPTTYVYNGPGFTYTSLGGAPPGDGSNLTGTVTFNIDTSNLTGWYGASAPVFTQVTGNPLPIVSNPIVDVTIQSGAYSGSLSSSTVTSQGGPVFYFQNGVITQWFILFVSGQTVFLTENWPVYTEDSLFLGYPNGTNGTGEIGGTGGWIRQ